MKKGQTYIITSGIYSDYGIRDSFVALRDFSFDKALDEWLAQNGESDRHFGYDPAKDDQAFLKSLRERGLVADSPLNEVHLHEYGTVDKDPAEDRGDEP